MFNIVEKLQNNKKLERKKIKKNKKYESFFYLKNKIFFNKKLFYCESRYLQNYIKAKKVKAKERVRKVRITERNQETAWLFSLSVMSRSTFE